MAPRGQEHFKAASLGHDVCFFWPAGIPYMVFLYLYILLHGSRIFQAA